MSVWIHEGQIYRYCMHILLGCFFGAEFFIRLFLCLVCINNIPNFRITESVLHDIKKLFPSFIITVAFKNHIGDIDFDYSNEEWDNENYDYASYGRYAGSYAQDEMGYSDDDIDTIFEGDPSAYWNID